MQCHNIFISCLLDGSGRDNKFVLINEMYVKCNVMPLTSWCTSWTLLLEIFQVSPPVQNPMALVGRSSDNQSNHYIENDIGFLIMRLDGRVKFTADTQ